MTNRTTSLARRFMLALPCTLAFLVTPVADAQDAPAAAMPSPHILATDWGLTLESDGTGFYNDLARLAILGAKPDANYEIQPYRRAKARFFREQTSCLYPSNLKVLTDGQEIENTEGYIDSAPILRVRVFLFAQPGKQPPASLADVNNRTVAYAMGSRVPYFLRNAQADYIAVTDEMAKAQMLLSGRVDLMSAAMPDLKFVLDKLGVPLPPYNPAFALNDTMVRVTCHDTPENRAFLQVLNARTKAAIGDGSLAAFLTAQGLDAALYLPAGD